MKIRLFNLCFFFWGGGLCCTAQMFLHFFKCVCLFIVVACQVSLGSLLCGSVPPARQHSSHLARRRWMSGGWALKVFVALTCCWRPFDPSYETAGARTWLALQSAAAQIEGQEIPTKEQREKDLLSTSQGFRFAGQSPRVTDPKDLSGPDEGQLDVPLVLCGDGNVSGVLPPMWRWMAKCAATREEEIEVPEEEERPAERRSRQGHRTWGRCAKSISDWNGKQYRPTSIYHTMDPVLTASQDTGHCQGNGIGRAACSSRSACVSEDGRDGCEEVGRSYPIYYRALERDKGQPAENPQGGSSRGKDRPCEAFTSFQVGKCQKGIGESPRKAVESGRQLGYFQRQNERKVHNTKRGIYANETGACRNGGGKAKTVRPSPGGVETKSSCRTANHDRPREDGGQWIGRRARGVSMEMPELDPLEDQRALSPPKKQQKTDGIKA